MASHRSHCFTSRGQVHAHWQSLLRESEDASRAIFRTPLDMEFMSAQGMWYRVSLANPDDAEAICNLSEEFVRTHANTFPEYCDAEHNTWSQYLGLHPDLVKRRQACVDVAKKNMPNSNRLGGVLDHAGCALKCELLKRSTPEDKKVRTHDPHLSGPVPIGRRLPGGTRGRGRGFPARPGGAAIAGHTYSTRLVGYVHFELEDGKRPDALRASARLRRKRGERGHEYIKVNSLIVNESHRGRGLGTLLLTAVLDRVCALDPNYAREMFLTVVERNRGAVALYQGMGFCVIGKNVTYVGQDLRKPVSWFQMEVKKGEATEPPAKKLARAGPGNALVCRSSLA